MGVQRVLAHGPHCRHVDQMQALLRGHECGTLSPSNFTRGYNEMGSWDGTDQGRANHVNAALREHISEGVPLTGAGALKRMFMDEDGVRFLRNAAVDANPSSL